MRCSIKGEIPDFPFSSIIESKVLTNTFWFITVFENHRKSRIQNFGQTVLPDRSLLIEQKLMENTKIENFKWDILVIFNRCVDFVEK